MLTKRVAALAWIACQVRPDLSYRVSKLQSVAGKGFIRDSRECNKLLEHALEHSTQGIFFCSTGVDWSDAVVCTVSDASFCNESVTVGGLKEDGRSQQGHVICLAPGGIVNMTEAMIHPISWSSTTIKGCVDPH